MGTLRCKGNAEGQNAVRTRPEMPDEVKFAVCGLHCLVAHQYITIVQDVHSMRGKVYSEQQKAQAWNETTQTVQNYSDEMIKRWKEEIDTYLVFVRSRLAAQTIIPLTK